MFGRSRFGQDVYGAQFNVTSVTFSGAGTSIVSPRRIRGVTSVLIQGAGSYVVVDPIVLHAILVDASFMGTGTLVSQYTYIPFNPSFDVRSATRIVYVGGEYRMSYSPDNPDRYRTVYVAGENRVTYA